MKCYKLATLKYQKVQDIHVSAADDFGNRNIVYWDAYGNTCLMPCPDNVADLLILAGTPFEDA